MVALSDISKIGFGMYRVSPLLNGHFEALTHAIWLGCNLLDTSSNYGAGASELMVADLWPKHKREDLFIVTKAGYISDVNLSVLKKLNEEGKALEDLCQISPGFLHSIHPEYLDAQIAVSLKRMKVDYIDGFLLHSPEYYFDQKGAVPTVDEYYRRIALAFRFLEEKVKQGIIRYYGISSNTFPKWMEDEKATNLRRLLDIARGIGPDNHFKLIQFPYNINERLPETAKDADSYSLITLAKEYGIHTFANRPLNANSASGVIRLAMNNTEHLNMDLQYDTALSTKTFELLESKIKEADEEADISQFPLVAYLKDNWDKVPHQDAFEKLFNGTFIPFTQMLYEGEMPDTDKKLFQDFQNMVWNRQLINANKRVIDCLAENQVSHLLPKNGSPYSLPHQLCEEYLHRGLDHVLVGMRATKYVDELATLF